ncbi:hypothetical protein BOTBODRAFT_31798 [Botryobasidium botryosum FD-172 SS1]|uniref:Uncharacterized protein n=1 Tax=Botryobasidium botryosum (strain FD-172 SS1) TaxID=930990 RepID=A0A067MI76_BOTB1|nr:hypothetical protein BOTBODRAFT_31798 [Botryobasidium botryosum FD-172 SS1]
MVPRLNVLALALAALIAIASPVPAVKNAPAERDRSPRAPLTIEVAPVSEICRYGCI